MDLIACPFCDGRAAYKAGVHTGYVMCLKCEVMGPNLPENEAVAAWNQRAARSSCAPSVGKSAIAFNDWWDRRVEEFPFKQGGEKGFAWVAWCAAIDSVSTALPECATPINAGNNSTAGLAESHAPAPSEPGDRGVAPTASASSPAPTAAPAEGPTPRVDGLTGTFYLRCDACPQPEKCEQMKAIHPDDARQLERELAECRTMLGAEHDAHMECHRKLDAAPVSASAPAQEKP